MNYLKGNTFPKSRDLGDLNVWLLQFTFSFNHINYLKTSNIEINVREMNDCYDEVNSRNVLLLCK